MSRSYKKILALLLAFAMIISTGSPLMQLGYAEDGSTAVEEVQAEEQTQEAAEEQAEPEPAAESEIKLLKTAAVEPAKTEEAAADQTASDADKASEEKTDPDADVKTEDKAASDEAADKEKAEEPAEKEKTEEEPEEEKFPAISEKVTTDGGVIVTIDAPEGAFPEGTKVVVKDVDAGSVIAAADGLLEGEAVDAKAVDISFVKDGEELEPKDGKAVSVALQVKGLFKKVDGDNHYAVHVKDNGEAEIIGNADVTAKTAEFKADEFSIYAIVGEDEEYIDRIKVMFYNGSALVDVQSVVSGERLDSPDPTPNQPGKARYTWEVLSDGQGTGQGTDLSSYFGKALTDEQITTLRGMAGSSTTDEGDNNTQVWVVRADVVWDTGYIVSMHQDVPNSALADNITTTIVTDKSGVADLTTVDTAVYEDDATRLIGWTNESGNHVAGIESITVTEDTDLWPELAKGEWISLDTGCSAQTKKVFAEQVSGSTTEYTVDLSQLPAATAIARAEGFNPGYEFAGWKLNGDGGLLGTEGSIRITKNDVIKAVWTPGNAEYTVVYMIEGPENGPGEGNYTEHSKEIKTGTSGSKTKGLSEEKTISGYHVAGSNASLPEETLPNPYLNGQVPSVLNNKEVTIAGDGSSVVTVYLNRNRGKLSVTYGEKTFFSSYTSIEKYHGYAKDGQALSVVDSEPEDEFLGTFRNAGKTRVQIGYSGSGTVSTGYMHTRALDANGKSTALKFNKTISDGATIVYITSDTWSAGSDPNKYTVVLGECDKVTDYSSVTDHGYTTKTDGGFITRTINGEEKRFYILEISRSTSSASAGYAAAGNAYGVNSSSGKYNLIGYEHQYAEFTPISGSDVISTKVGTTDGMTSVFLFAERVENKLTYTNLDGYEISSDKTNLEVKYDSNVAYTDPGLKEDVSTRHYNNTTMIFKGWYDESSAANNPTDEASASHKIDLDTYKMPGKDVVLYAGWVPATHTVTFDSNGGTEVAFQTVTSGTTTTEPAKPKKTIDGKEATFGGWYVDEELTQPFDFLTDKVSSDITLYARWLDGSTYTITYHTYDGNSEIEVDDKKLDNKSYFTGATATVAAAPANDDAGYNGDEQFVAWSRESDPDKRTSNTIGHTIAMTENIDLYPAYGDVVFNMGDGPSVLLHSNYADSWNLEEKTSEIQTARPNTTIELKKASEYGIDDLDKYYFMAWNTKADLSGDDWIADEDHTTQLVGVRDDERPTNLYVKWGEKDDKLTLNKNADDADSVTGTVSGITYDEVTVPDGAATRTGYTLSGWNTKADGSGTSYAIGSNYALTLDEDVVYAQWTVNSYNVTYKYDGDVPAAAAADLPDDASYDYGARVNIAYEPEAVSGYTFKGWKIGDDDAADFTMPAEDVTITGVWEVNSYSVSYQYTGSVPESLVGKEPAESSHAYGSEVTVEAAPDTVEGYTFDGWKKDGAVVTSFTMPNADVEITGKWTKNSHTVTYTYAGDLPGAADALPAATSYEYGNSVTIADTPTNVTGFTFSGWKIDGEDAEDFDMPDTNVTITGTWTINSHNVTYSYTGSTPDDPPALPAEASYNYGTTVSIAAPPSVAGYTFEGWKIGNDDAASFNMPDNDVAITGKWVKEGYTITYEMNDEDGTVTYPEGYSNPSTYDVTNEFTLMNPISKELSDGQGTVVTFKGWSGTGIDGTSESVSVGAGSTGNRVYTAVWNNPPYLSAGEPTVKEGTSLEDALKAAGIVAQDLENGENKSDITASSEMTINGDGKEQLGNIVVEDAGTYDPEVPGEHTVKVSYTDSKGNKVYKDIKIKVDGAPKLNASDVEVGEGKEFDEVLDSMSVSATDEDGTLTSTQVVSEFPSEAEMTEGKIYVTKGGYDPDEPGEYTVTFKVKDSTGNVSTKTATVTVNGKPELSANAVTVSEGTSLNVAFGKTNAKATDHEDDDISDNIRITNDGGYNPNKSGTYEVTYAVTDSFNQTETKKVKITVDMKPVFTGDDKTVAEGTSLNDALTAAGVSVTDEEDKNINYIIASNGNYNPNVPGEYKVILSATDSAGNTVTKTITLTVDAKPEISADNKTVKEGTTVANALKEAGLSITDNKDAFNVDDAEYGTIPSVENMEAGKVYVDDSAYKANKAGTYDVTVKVKDSAGNVVEKTVKLTVDAKPVVTVDESPEVGEGTSIEDAIDKLVTVTDHEDGKIKDKVVGSIPSEDEMEADKIYIDPGSYDPNKSGDYTVKVKVKDSTGNVVEQEITIHVNGKPVVNTTEVPAKVVPHTSFDDIIKYIKVTDDDGGDYSKKVVGPFPLEDDLVPGTVYIHDGGYDPTKPGTYTITVKTKDEFGNITIEKFEITVTGFVHTSDPAIGDPPVKKTISGDTPSKDATFTFTMTAADASYPMPSGSKDGSKTLTIKGAGEAEFGDIIFEKAGTYTYKVTEVNAAEEGYTYSTEVYTVTYTVVDNNGELKCTRSITNSAGSSVSTCAFENVYDAKEESSGSSKKSKGINTGDHNQIVLYSSALIAGALLLAVLAVRRRKEEDR